MRLQNGYKEHKNAKIQIGENSLNVKSPLTKCSLQVRKGERTKPSWPAQAREGSSAADTAGGQVVHRTSVGWALALPRPQPSRTAPVPRCPRGQRLPTRQRLGKLPRRPRSRSSSVPCASLALLKMPSGCSKALRTAADNGSWDRGTLRRDRKPRLLFPLCEPGNEHLTLLEKKKPFCDGKEHCSPSSDFLHHHFWRKE